MKKTLIALAVLAASGASFAQVTITGNVIFGYEVDHHATGTLGDTSGLGNDTSFVKFAASEDLGGGMKASAEMSLDGFARTAANGGDSSLSLEGAFGKLTLATTKGADYLSGGVATVGGNGLDGKVFSVKTVSDSIAYAYPIGPVTLSLSHADSVNSASGLGQGAAGGQGTNATTNFDGVTGTATDNQRSTRIAAKYAAGPLVVDGGYAVYDQAGNASTGAASTLDKSQIRAAAAYDLGVAKIGGGIVQNQKVVGTRTDWLVSGAVPFGAVTFGLNYGNRTTNGYADSTKDGSVAGYGLNVSYALSKRTSASLSYTSFKPSITAGENSTYTAALLSHSF